MEQSASSKAAHFYYVTGGKTYRVIGERDNPMRFQRVPMWQGFRVDVYDISSENEITPLATNWFMLTSWFGEFLGDVNASNIDAKLKWLQAMRRYALIQIMHQLDTGTLVDGDDTTITTSMKQQLSEFLPRICEFMYSDVSGKKCKVDSANDPATTRSICHSCMLPDMWERCKNVTNIRTFPISTNEEGIVARHCTALCELGKRPSESGGIPNLCRFYESTPRCFEPKILEGMAEKKQGYMGLIQPSNSS